MIVKWDHIGIMSILIYPLMQKIANLTANLWRLLVHGFPPYWYTYTQVTLVKAELASNLYFLAENIRLCIVVKRYFFRNIWNRCSIYLYGIGPLW
jgi:hypothetical protein